MSAEAVALRAESAVEQMLLGLAVRCPLWTFGRKGRGTRRQGSTFQGRAGPRHWGWNRCHLTTGGRASLYRWELNGPGSREDLSKVTC